MYGRDHFLLFFFLSLSPFVFTQKSANFYTILFDGVGAIYYKKWNKNIAFS